MRTITWLEDSVRSDGYYKGRFVDEEGRIVADVNAIDFDSIGEIEQRYNQFEELSQERKRREGLEKALKFWLNYEGDNLDAEFEPICREALLTKVGEAAQASNEGSEGGKV